MTICFFFFLPNFWIDNTANWTCRLPIQVYHIISCRWLYNWTKLLAIIQIKMAKIITVNLWFGFSCIHLFAQNNLLNDTSLMCHNMKGARNLTKKKGRVQEKYTPSSLLQEKP